MANLPYFKFYPADFTGSGKVQMMSPAERGIYISLLCHSWKEGPLPDDPSRLARAANATPAEMEDAWPLVRKCFDKGDDGFLRNERLEKERAEALDRREKAQKAARASVKARREASAQADAQADAEADAEPQGQAERELEGEPLEASSEPAILIDSESQSTENPPTEDESSGASPDVENPNGGVHADVGSVVAPILRKRWWQGKDPPPKAPPKWNMGREINVCKRLIEREGWTVSSLGEALAEYEGPPATLAIVQKEGNRHVLYRLMEKVKQRERLKPSRAGEVLNEMQRKAANA